VKERRVVISGGGTGGHLYPALVLGQKLQQRNSSLDLIYVGSSRETERQIMSRHRVRFVPMVIEGLKGRGLRSIRAAVLLPAAFLRSLVLLVRLKPDLVIGVGGYSSGPVVIIAAMMKIPTLILEQNVRPGLTNRLLLPWVKKAVAAFDSSLPDFRGKAVALGNPVREEFFSLPAKERDGRLTILIFGGSQGSHFLNRAVTMTLPLLQQAKSRISIFHQTGPTDLVWVAASYRQSGFTDAVIAAYFFDMPDYFRKSDLIISRAGATTCAELIAARKASLLIPFAGAADNHQTLNAAALEAAGGADVMLENEWTPIFLAERIGYYLQHPERISAMEKNLAPMIKEAAADRIASLCFDLMEGRP
jgi:UDP-N-acetylglucosamine--N-acetylmuramyl-(pentapeptide) pyrophosphoryl-undecaprenol N-acetylglucosamine transferase